VCPAAPFVALPGYYINAEVFSIQQRGNMDVKARVESKEQEQASRGRGVLHDGTVVMKKAKQKERGRRCGRKEGSKGKSPCYCYMRFCIEGAHL
jgi:hypothetical protein